METVLLYSRQRYWVGGCMVYDEEDDWKKHVHLNSSFGCG
jgi:uncharacterized protein YciU (UPF0263 family)